MANYDIIGNIVIVKFKRGTKTPEKKKFAIEFLKEHKNVKTILEKATKFKGRLRTIKTKFIYGEKTKEAIYRENGCTFYFNVDKCYFSPRLSSERKEIAEDVKKDEDVLVLFGGVAPFAIVIAKTGKPKSVTSIELSRACNLYAKENVRLNKVNVNLIQGDVRKILLKPNKKWDRIVMPRPNLKDTFLDIVFPIIKKNGIIHFYGFSDEKKKEHLINVIKEESNKFKKKISIIKIKKAGDIGVRRYRYRIDFKVLN